jgi:hypothetical protein
MLWKNIEKFGDSYSLNIQRLVPKNNNLKQNKKLIWLKYGKW